MSDASGYFDAYGMPPDVTAVLNLVYGPDRLGIDEAAVVLGLETQQVEALVRGALTRIGRLNR